MWNEIKKNLVCILLWLFTATTFFQLGIIWELKGLDGIQRRLSKIEFDQKELSGKVESHHAILRGISKGRTPQVP